MNVNQSSTATSTGFREAVIAAEADLAAARKAGARTETINAIEKRLQDLKNKAESESKYRDIRYLKEWPAEVLITNYEKVCRKAKDYIDNAGPLSLLDTPEKKEKYQQYLAMIKLIENLEDEGRERGIAYFLTEKELQAIFEVSPEEENKPSLPTTVTNQAGEQL